LKGIDWKCQPKDFGLWLVRLIISQDAPMKRYGASRWEITMGFILLLAILGSVVQVIVFLTGSG